MQGRLKAHCVLPAAKQAVYWLRITNVLPPGVIVSPKSLSWTSVPCGLGDFTGGRSGRDVPCFPPEALRTCSDDKDGKHSSLQVKLSLKGSAGAVGGACHGFFGRNPGQTPAGEAQRYVFSNTREGKDRDSQSEKAQKSEGQDVGSAQPDRAGEKADEADETEIIIP